MRRFFLALAVYFVGLYSLGVLLFPATSEAARWVYCAGPSRQYPYVHVAHSPRRCSAPGLWIRVGFGL